MKRYETKDQIPWDQKLVANDIDPIIVHIGTKAQVVSEVKNC